MLEDHYQNMLDHTGQLKAECVDEIMCEILSGRHLFEAEGEVLASRHPSPADLDHARMRYAKRLRELRQERVMTRQELVDAGHIDPLVLNEKKRIYKLIESNTKTRSNTNDPAQKLELDHEMERLRQEAIRIEYEEMEITRFSAESRAESARADFLVSVCTMTGDLLDERRWPSFELFRRCTDDALVTESRWAHMRVMRGTPITIVRALARSDEWRVRWKGIKESGGQAFEGPSTSWSRDQIHLVYWSDFYDTVHAHPDCPDRFVIDDDHALQQWMNRQVAKNKKNRQTSDFEGSGGNWRKKMTKVGHESIAVNQPYKRH